MRRSFLISLCLATISVSAPSFADSESKSTLKIEDVSEQRNTVPGDLDQEITSPKLRADSGSKSRYSMSTTMSYTGGSLMRPFGEGRPNLSGVPENQTDTSLDGSLRVRYRPSMNTSYTVGVTMGLKTPLQGNVGTTQNQFNMGDPIVGRNHTFAAWGLQNSWNLTGSAATSYESLHIDQVASAATDYTIMKVFRNGLHVGLTATAWYNFFSSNPGSNTYTANASGGNYPDTRTSWETTFYPTVDYYFTDRVAVRTLFGYFSWRHLYGSENAYSMSKLKEYQSVGLGLSVTRDIYVYPNVQFLPKDLRSDFTNVGVSSTINVF